MLIRIVDIDGKPPSKKALAEMSLRDRNALRQEMARVDAGIDTAVEVACEACGTLLRTRLEAEPAFDCRFRIEDCRLKSDGIG